jgi:hypothetical protein
MLHLHPTEDICVGHPANYISRGPGVSLIVASHEGRVSRLNPGLSVVLPHRTRNGDLQSCSAHPSSPLLAIVGEEGRKLRVVHFDGSSIFDGQPSGNRNSTFEECFFDPGGTRLWCLVASAPQAVVECREVDSLSVIEKLVFENETGEGRPIFEYCRPDLGLLFLPQSADVGGRVYWLDPGHSTRAPRISREPSLDDILVVAPPVFSQDGSEFLVMDQDRVVHRFAYPPSRPLGACPLQPTDADYFPSATSYLNQRLALVGTGNGRIMLLGLDSMRVVDEIVIEGHEPRPMNEYFREMRDFHQLATDITSTHEVNGWLYCVHPPENATLGPWGRDKYSVLCMSVDSALAQLGFDEVSRT